MNDFETTLSSVLHSEADRATLTVNPSDASHRLVTRLDRVDRDRAHRTWGAVAAVAAAAAAVVLVALVLAGGRTSRSAPPVGPPTTPAVPGGEVIARHPYIGLTFWGHNVRQSGWPPRLTHCVDDPSTWGAEKAQGATFVNPEVNQADSLVRVNEFLLQYASPADADQALRHAAHQVMNCPPRGRAFHQNPSPDSPISRTPAAPQADYDELWIGVRSTWPTPDRSQWPSFCYIFRVARADNVLVVLESTGVPEDRSGISMDLAVQKALPHFPRSHWLPPGTTRPWLHKDRRHHGRSQ